MRPRERRRALVIVRDGPSVERGWLALRTALALGLGGFEVAVWLDGGAVAFAAAGLDARAWLDGDPRADVSGLIEDAGARVFANDAGEGDADRDGLGPRLDEMLPGVQHGSVDAWIRLFATADLVLTP